MEKEDDARTPLTYDGALSKPVDYNAVFGSNSDTTRDQFATRTAFGEVFHLYTKIVNLIS